MECLLSVIKVFSECFVFMNLLPWVGGVFVLLVGCICALEFNYYLGRWSVCKVLVGCFQSVLCSLCSDSDCL